MTLSTESPRTRSMHVDAARLLDHLDLLRSVGATPEGGVSRPAFGDADVRGRELVAGFMREAGMRVHVDPAANLIGAFPARRPELGALVLGSHLDTVPNGGSLDGAYGVIAAVEVMRTLHENRVEMDHPVMVVAFSNEEGAHGTPAMFGSRAVAGQVDASELDTRLDDGRVLSALVDAAGGDSKRIDQARWPGDAIASYMELHIEQGPSLEGERLQIGVVEGITGRLTAEVVVRGEHNHGGTTPMDARRDALVAAAQVVLAVQDMATRGGLVRVATVGECSVRPGAWNVIPGEVRLVVDLRDVSAQAIRAGLLKLRLDARRISDRTATSITVTPQQLVVPAMCDERLRGLVEDAAVDLGLGYRSMPSGAGHDAQWIARIAPMGMIFVPSRGGVSHAPHEWTDPSDLVNGANVLLNCTLAGDRAFRAGAVFAGEAEA
ncbi:M20 family metallo-hydrolase [Sphaerisporangium sp. TRM90804]|uniref:M20 family metallo-hydrolase n=1 Tax=Sphaerisporangium sp. TRM90804 TaxID=3031113 RepID=UPI002449F81B|nr:M20 family metallo-hydrolase [Sphaerisporangium sp. TRM90804]MDH2427993.1 M20 family metallo-hydrolase [Sphaerisporangium sp. TRM90804]